MKYLKMPWYLIKGIVVLIAFWVVVFFYPFFMVVMMLLEIGGMDGVGYNTHKHFEWMLDKISSLV